MDNVLTNQQRSMLESIALLKASTIDRLSEKTGFHRHSIKIILESLEKKGFIKKSIANGKINYFLQDIDKKEQEYGRRLERLNRLIPSLELHYQETKNTQQLNILKGPLGLRTVLFDEIMKGSEINAFHLSDVSQELENEYRSNNERRVASGIKINILSNKENELVPLSRIKKTAIKSNIDITIYADKLTIVHNKRSVDVITVKIPQITLLFSQIFDSHWKSK